MTFHKQSDEKLPEAYPVQTQGQMLQALNEAMKKKSKKKKKKSTSSSY